VEISTSAQFAPHAIVSFDLDLPRYFAGPPPDPLSIILLTSPDGALFSPLPTSWLEAGPRSVLSAVASHFSFFALAAPASELERFKRGDAGGDGAVDISDAIATLEKLFLGTGEIACDDGADANDDGAVDISDPIQTLTFLFLGGIQLPDPGPEACGPDATGDGLSCRMAAGC
jgi:hypothetical protein